MGTINTQGIRPIIIDYNKGGEDKDTKIAIIGYQKSGKVYDVMSMAEYILEERRKGTDYDEMYVRDRDVQVDEYRMMYTATIYFGNKAFPLNNHIDYSELNSYELAKCIEYARSIKDLDLPKAILQSGTDWKEGEYPTKDTSVIGLSW